MKEEILTELFTRSAMMTLLKREREKKEAENFSVFPEIGDLSEQEK